MITSDATIVPRYDPPPAYKPENTMGTDGIAAHGARRMGHGGWPGSRHPFSAAVNPIKTLSPRGVEHSTSPEHTLDPVPAVERAGVEATI